MNTTTLTFNSFQALTEDVNRQVEREKVLQKKYAELKEQLEDLKIEISQ